MAQQNINWKNYCTRCIYLIILPAILLSQTKHSDVQGWAVIIEKEDYTDVGMPASYNLSTNYLMTEKLKFVFSYFDWPNDNIMIIHDECNQLRFKGAIEWLSNHADFNDIVFLYYDGHGKYLREKIKFNDFFSDLWDNIESKNKVVLLSCCYAGEFIKKIPSNLDNSICIGGVDEDEIIWKGVWHERLPIIGSVFTNYFIESLTNPVADIDSNGFVSISEACNYAESMQRNYMQNTLWSNSNFKNDSLAILKDVPHVVVKNNTDAEIYLNLRYYK